MPAATNIFTGISLMDTPHASSLSAPLADQLPPVFLGSQTTAESGVLHVALIMPPQREQLLVFSIAILLTHRATEVLGRLGNTPLTARLTNQPASCELPPCAVRA